MERISLYDKPAGVRRLLDIKTAVLYSGISRARLYILIKQQKIKAYKDGRRTMVDASSVDAYQNALPQVGVV